MINWNERMATTNAQREKEIADAQTAEHMSRMAEEKRIADQKAVIIKQNQIDGAIVYNEQVIPAFAILDKFHVREMLEGIRTQVWGEGSVLKNYINLDEFINFRENIALRNNDEATKRWDSDIWVSYSLETPKYLVNGRTDNGPTGPAGDDFSIDTEDCLIVSTDSKTLRVQASDDETNYRKIIEISLQGDDLTISQWLEKQLTEDCFKRTHYKNRNYLQMSKKAFREAPFYGDENERMEWERRLYNPISRFVIRTIGKIADFI